MINLISLSSPLLASCRPAAAPSASPVHVVEHEHCSWQLLPNNHTFVQLAF
jgi:hypothetical protein